MMPKPFKDTKTTVADAAIWVGPDYMDLLNPNPAEIHLDHIARALTRLCRFNGHGRAFYSVAEHSVNCARLYLRDRGQIENLGGHDREIARAILMHDAAEAYLGDITSPLKAHLPEFRRIEARMQSAIGERFGLISAPDAIKACDLAMLAAEKATLLPDCPDDWPCLEGVEDPGIFIYCERPHIAELNFLHMAEQLGLPVGGQA